MFKVLNFSCKTWGHLEELCHKNFYRRKESEKGYFCEVTYLKVNLVFEVLLLFSFLEVFVEKLFQTCQ